MPSEYTWNQFSAGWIPSDDSQNGRKNGMLRMDNVELDKNGSLSLTGGKKYIRSYSSNAFALFSAIVGGTESLYAATRDGKIWKDDLDTDLVGGSDSIAAFSNGIGNVLIASGDIRVKDDGTNVYKLGLPDITTTSLSLVAGAYTDEITIASWAYTSQSGSGTTSTPSFVLTAPGTPPDTLFITMNLGSFYDFSTLPNGNGTPTTYFDSTDIINFSITATGGDLSGVSQITLTFGTTSIGGNNFTYTQATVYPTGTTVANITINRSQFEGVGSPDWALVGQIFFQIVYSTTFTFTLGATVIPIVDASITPPSTHYAFYNGINQSGSTALINYTAIAVATNSNYQALGGGLDAIGEFINILVPPGVFVSVSVTASTDFQVNGIWIYREGGDLNQWYRAVVAPNTTGAYIDSTYDETALATDIVLNINTYSVQGTGQGLDQIYSIIGPIEGRWFYFSTSLMIPSVINDPDLVDVSLAVTTASSENELFMWAVKVAEGYVLVGTSVDIYILSGTFTTLPDGELDIYYRPMTCQFPPITRQCTFAKGLIYYMGMDGWRSIGTDASTSTLMVVPSTDVLYKAEARYGYAGVNLTDSPIGTQYFPVVATRNKLWCGIYDRIEVWDFLRQYWRTFNYGLGEITASTRSVLGIPIMAFSGKTVYYCDGYDSLTSDNEPQTVSILSSIFDPSGALTRNDLYTLKIRLMTGQGEQLVISIITKDNTTYFIGTATSFTDIETEVILDLNDFIPFPTETFQFLLTGQFTKLVISDIRVIYDSRPQQLTTLRGYNSNFGTAGKKRLRMWPFVIDTMGNDVTFTPIIDNISGTSQLINTNDKTTVPIFLNFDAFGVDYGYLIKGGPFEFWEAGQPEVVQSLPTPKMYDQVGPQELFRYGKIRELELRLLPNGGDIGTTAQLPYTLYFDDYSIYTNTLTVNNGLEQTYSFGLPKGVAGSIVRIELGPTSYTFVRYYLRARVMVHGYDTTDNSKWITL